jgi:hypothetical protein
VRLITKASSNSLKKFLRESERWLFEGPNAMDLHWRRNPQKAHTGQDLAAEISQNQNET